MNDFIIACESAKALSEAIVSFFHSQDKAIRLCNAKLCTKSLGKTKWFYNVIVKVDDEEILLYPEGEATPCFKVGWQDMISLKLRPYYYAACIGNKNILFHIKEGYDDSKAQK